MKTDEANILHSKKLNTYLSIIVASHFDEDNEDLQEQCDDLWWDLSEEEKYEVRGVIADLNGVWLDGYPVGPSNDPHDIPICQLQELEKQTKGGVWDHRLLLGIRKTRPRVDSVFASSCRAFVWHSIGNRDISNVFYRDLFFNHEVDPFQHWGSFFSFLSQADEYDFLRLRKSPQNHSILDAFEVISAFLNEKEDTPDLPNLILFSRASFELNTLFLIALFYMSLSAENFFKVDINKLIKIANEKHQKGQLNKEQYRERIDEIIDGKISAKSTLIKQVIYSLVPKRSASNKEIEVFPFLKELVAFVDFSISSKTTEKESKTFIEPLARGRMISFLKQVERSEVVSSLHDVVFLD